MGTIKYFGLAGLVCAFSGPASATTINFDDQGLTGPSLFASTTTRPQNLSIDTVDGNVKFEGGVILTAATNLPANRTSIYGTANFVSNLSNPLKVTFENPVENFFLDVLNGNTIPIAYTVSDDAGNSQMFTLDPNLNGGRSQIGFAATGSEVLIQAALSDGSTGATYDFFVDNITFNEALPPDLKPPMSPVPLPPAAGLIAMAFAGLGFVVRNKRKPLGRI